MKRFSIPLAVATIILMTLGFGPFGPVGLFQNSWSTNRPPRAVEGVDNLQVTNLGSGTGWTFYGVGPKTVARLIDATNVANAVGVWTNDGQFIRPSGTTNQAIKFRGDGSVFYGTNAWEAWPFDDYSTLYFSFVTFPDLGEQNQQRANWYVKDVADTYEGYFDMTVVGDPLNSYANFDFFAKNLNGDNVEMAFGVHPLNLDLNAMALYAPGLVYRLDQHGDIKTIKGVTYSWPALQGDASTFLQNDGMGNLIWVANAIPDTNRFIASDSGKGTSNVLAKPHIANSVGDSTGVELSTSNDGTDLSIPTGGGYSIGGNSVLTVHENIVSLAEGVPDGWSGVLIDASANEFLFTPTNNYSYVPLSLGGVTPGRFLVGNTDPFSGSARVTNSTYSEVDIANLQGATNGLNTSIGNLRGATNGLNTRVGNLEGATNGLNTAISNLQGSTNSFVKIQSGTANQLTTTNMTNIAAATFNGTVGGTVAPILHAGTNSVNGLTVTTNGNVGIGTNAPAQALDVTGSIQSSANGYFTGYVSATNGLVSTNVSGHYWKLQNLATGFLLNFDFDGLTVATLNNAGSLNLNSVTFAGGQIIYKYGAGTNGFGTSSSTPAGSLIASNIVSLGGFVSLGIGSLIPTNAALIKTIAPANLHNVALGKGWTNDLGARADLILAVKLSDAATGDPALAFTNTITGEAWTNSISGGLVQTHQITIVIPDLSTNDYGSFTDISTGSGSTLTILNAWWKLK